MKIGYELNRIHFVNKDKNIVNRGCRTMSDVAS